MSDTPPGPQRIVPYLSYSDAPAAIEFLGKAFGFVERSRMPMDDGRIGHAELELGDNVLYLASAYPEMGLISPGELPGVHCQLHCTVDDVDAHHRQAHEAGAVIVAEPAQSHGSRMYRAVDPEGHRWMFATPTTEEA